MNWGYNLQHEAHDKLVKSKGGIVWWAPGQGKTRIGIELFDTLRCLYDWGYPCVCVVVLKRSAFYDFRKEIIKIGYKCITVEDTLTMHSEAEIATLQLPTMLLVSAAQITKSVNSLLVDPRVKFAIIDELHLFKNPDSQRAKAVQRLTLKVKSVGLSGSIMTAQNIEDVYGQLMAVSKHRCVSPSFTRFRTEFMNMRMMERKQGRPFPFRSPKPGAYRRIMELCASCTHVHFPKKSDRKITMQVIEIPATPEQLAAFRDLKKWMEVEVHGQILELKTSMQVGFRIQQISNGWTTDDNGIVRKFPSNKLNFLCDKVEQLAREGHRVIIWCAFRQDVWEVDRALFARQIATVQFMGQEEFDVERWESGEAKVCVATEAMGVSVNHFEQVPYAFYFSMDYKWLDLNQSMKRTDRKSSLHPEAFYYFLQVEGSLDERIYKRVLGSRDWEGKLIDIGKEVQAWQREV